MKDYSVTIEVTISIEAPNEEKAEERAQMLTEDIKIPQRRWLGEVEIGDPEIEEVD